LSSDYVWHKETVESTFRELSTSESGLSSDEAKRRLTEYRPNELEEMDRVRLIRMFFQQFVNPMVIILFFAIAVSVAVVLVHGGHGFLIPINRLFDKSRHTR
jgi:Ca2+-transporting ATPase